MDTVKKNSGEIEKRTSEVSAQTHKKLSVYKKCLLQTVSYTKLINEVSGELEMITKEIEDYFKPLYNAFKQKKRILVKEPNEFDIKVSYDLLYKLEVLNTNLDDLIACEDDSTDVSDTLGLFDEIVMYYQNVTSSFKDFSSRYNNLKKQAIERSRKGSYDAIMSTVVEKVEENLTKDFKLYELIK